jgi:hypothetical protein
MAMQYQFIQEIQSEENKRAFESKPSVLFGREKKDYKNLGEKKSLSIILLHYFRATC